jgi:transcriptional regulator with PAS, ATPase and Fis domain
LIKADFRLLAATNQNLENMLKENRFRRDLFYRLNVINLHIPPLRERREDIIPLARYLLSQISHDSGLPEPRLESSAVDVLYYYDWPGNARELSNILEKVVSYLEEDTIYVRDLPFHIYRKRKGKVQKNGTSLKIVQDNAERDALRHALEATSYNKSRAAAFLGIHRSLLYKKMKKYGLPLKFPAP